VSERTDALVKGAVIALGAAAILDNLFSHWLLGLHRAVSGSWATPVEVALALTGTRGGRHRRAARAARAAPIQPSGDRLGTATRPARLSP
jgi:hypothetical protein